MKILVGLENPGEKYAHTRHNLGGDWLRWWGAQHAAPEAKLDRRSQALLSRFFYRDHSLILAWPQTYMNLSGKSVQSLWSYFSVSPSDVLVVSDDLDLPAGKFRLRCGGGTGGHNGLKSIIKALGTDQFFRLRLGIGRPPEQISAENYVLQKFSPADPALDQTSWRAAQQVLEPFWEA